MYWVVGPLNYETGQSPYAAGQAGVAFYWHPGNLVQCSANLGRIAAALSLVFRDSLSESDRLSEPWYGRVTALREVIQSHWDLFDESVRQFLISQGLGQQE